jgi:hypothetical protein
MKGGDSWISPGAAAGMFLSMPLMALLVSVVQLSDAGAVSVGIGLMIGCGLIGAFIEDRIS